MTTTHSWPPSWIKVLIEGLSSKDNDKVVKSEFEKYFTKQDRKPTIIKSVLDENTLKEWSFDNISSIVGDKEFEIYVSTSGNSFM